MIRLHLNSANLLRLRFAYSPLAEAAESLYLVHSGHVGALHSGWFAAAREAITRYDSPVLKAAVPPRGTLANIFLIGASDAATTIDEQLRCVAGYPPEQLRADLTEAWHGGQLPAVAQQLVHDGSKGLRRLADEIGAYWSAAIEPYWARIRPLLDADVAHRASRMSRGGIAAMMCNLHPDLAVDADAAGASARLGDDQALSHDGMVLVPSVFAWPWVIVKPGLYGPPTLVYGARGVGNLWESHPSAGAADGSLAVLLGRGRAAVLASLSHPRSTTEVARMLGQTAPTVSAHLGVLRRCGMVTSSRYGRSVLYQRTALATVLVDAGP
jgi:DNA-binding transcriptional ArsR family regulator